MTKILPEVAPKMLAIAESAEKHPKIIEYFAADGHLPYTGLNLLW